MGSRVLLMQGALLLPAICAQFLFSMRMMKTVLMCGCETGGGVWQEPKVEIPASSGVNANIAATHFGNFMTSSYELPTRHYRLWVWCRPVSNPGPFGGFCSAFAFH